MENPGLHKGLWSHLSGGLWHATGSTGLRGIVDDKEIRVAVGDRYRGSFCRCKGCVSLFDFGPTAEDVTLQFEHWCGWFGHQQKERTAIWLEIDRASVVEGLMDAQRTREAKDEAMDQWRAEGRTREPGIQLIAGVEACHKGPIPLATVTDVLLVDQHYREVHCRVGKPNDDIFQRIGAFGSDLQPHEEHPLADAIRRARAKYTKEP